MNYLNRQLGKSIGAFGPFVVRLTIWLLLMLVVCISAYWQLGNLGQPILEEHAFRQTQTALTTFYLIKNGFSLSYWTPVIGEGWSIPFEFPIYQEIVAVLVSLLGTPLTDTGRALSCALTMGCAIPIYLILREAGVNTQSRLFSIALFLSAPLYVFWGGTFMIESTALFFTLCCGVFGARLVCRPIVHAKTADLAGLGFFLTLGLLQKVTTALPLAIAIAVLIGFRGLLAREPLMGARIRYVAVVGVALAVPIVLAYLWIAYTDQIKSANPIATRLTSTALRTWNFGSWNQRISPELWIDVFKDRIFRWNMAGPVGALVLVTGLLVARETRVKLLICTLLGIGLLHMILFTNLHVVHNYYQNANLVYFIMALGVSAVVTCDRLFARWWLISCLALAFLVLTNLNAFRIGDMRLRFKVIEASTNRVLRVSHYVRSRTAADDVVVWYGLEWSSAAAFYSERKSLTVPEWGNLETDVIENTWKYVRQPPTAIVLCPTPNKELLRAAIERRFQSIAQTMVGDCEVTLLAKNSSK